MMCIHMAMAVTMRVVVNIVLRFYRNSPAFVKPIAVNNADFALRTGVRSQIADDSSGEIAMKICWILVLFACSVPAYAIHGSMEKATVHAMRKISCAESQGTGRPGILAGLVGENTGDGDCVEYVIRTEKVSYVIRPHRPVLLLVGGDVSIKLADSELILHINDAVKDIRCSVIAMSLRSEAEKAERERTPRCYAESGRQISCPDEP